VIFFVDVVNERCSVDVAWLGEEVVGDGFGGWVGEGDDGEGSESACHFAFDETLFVLLSVSVAEDFFAWAVVGEDAGGFG